MTVVEVRPAFLFQEEDQNPYFVPFTNILLSYLFSVCLLKGLDKIQRKFSYSFIFLLILQCNLEVHPHQRIEVFSFPFSFILFMRKFFKRLSLAQVSWYSSFYSSYLHSK